MSNGPTGPPGAGKSTLCARLASSYSSPTYTLKHVSFGATLRTERADPSSPLAGLRDDPNRTGSLVDDAVAVGVMLRGLGTALLEQSKNGPPAGDGDEGKKTVWLIDGHPKTVGMVKAWEREVSQSRRFRPDSSLN